VRRATIGSEAPISPAKGGLEPEAAASSALEREEYMKRDTCRGCGSTNLYLVHNFGDQPLAGEFPLVPESVEPARRFALDLSQCCSCGLLQVCNVPPIDEIFHDDYRYSSSTIPGLVRHFESYGQWIAARLPRDARVLEFGCNDGVLLAQLARQGFKCKGVDASANIAALARKGGHDVDVAFFGGDYVRSHNCQKHFDLITCSNVFAHIDNLSDVTSAAYEALNEGGMFAIEVHDGQFILTPGQFDTIYHEHLSYFSEASIALHLRHHGFNVVEIAHTPMHGGGLRVLSKRSDSVPGKMLSMQLPVPLMSDQLIRHELIAASEDVFALKRAHHKLWGYGAAGRSQMFLNFTKTAKMFEMVYDDSPLRQGRYIVATDLHIGTFEQKKHDGACVILAWNYAEDIVKRIAPFFDAVYTVLPEAKRWI
jgi:SAM-dependent methyltransferase